MARLVRPPSRQFPLFSIKPFRHTQTPSTQIFTDLRHCEVVVQFWGVMLSSLKQVFTTENINKINRYWHFWYISLNIRITNYTKNYKTIVYFWQKHSKRHVTEFSWLVFADSKKQTIPISRCLEIIRHQVLWFNSSTLKVCRCDINNGCQ